ncbi:MAG: LCP family protein, partial [Acidimicrobiia bacterium]|nr:LCP family protein [Acidimicrobiia bacterium]
MSDSPAKKWLRRVVIAALVLANSVVAFVLWQVNQVETIIEEDVVTVDAVEPHLNQPPSDPEEPITFLVLGSDSRDNLPDDWLGDFGVFGGQRADVIMLLKAVPATGELLLMSIPRDLRVDIDGYGTQKINSAYAFGGAPLMVQTVREQFQVPIHHYVEIDFVGFAGLVDELGGLPLEFASPARDLKSGLSVDAGRQILDGRAALAYARSRSYQEFRGGSWVSVDANDIGRTGRQQQLVLAIISEVKRPSNL